MNNYYDIFKNINGDLMKKTKTIITIIIYILLLNYGLMGLFNIEFISFIFGNNTLITRLIYILIGLSGLILIIYYFKK